MDKHQITPADKGQKLARVGGATSQASKKIAPDKGSTWASMQAILLHGTEPDANQLAPGSNGRQFRTIGKIGEAKTLKLGSVRKITR